MDFWKKDIESRSKRNETFNASQGHCGNKYASSRTTLLSLSYIGNKIKQELKIMRMYQNALYDDLVEAAFRVVKSYAPGNFVAINSEFDCHTKIGLFNKNAARRELAEKMIAQLENFELRILLGR